MVSPKPTVQGKLLTVLREEDRYLELVGAGHEGVDFEYHPTVGSASRSLISDEPPFAVLTDLQHLDCSGIELLGVLESQAIRIPVLILVPATQSARIDQDHPFLTFLPHFSPAEIAAVVATAAERAAAAPEGPMFRILDYLRLAIELKQSVALRLRFGADAELRIEVLGGDLWNVYAGTETGFRVLSRLALAAPKRVRASHVHAVPTERQIYKAPDEVLRHLSLGVGVELPELGTSGRETQPIDFVDFIPRREGDEARVSRSGDQDGSSPASDDGYSVAVANGIDAALRRDFVEAIKAFEKALETRPNDPQAQYNLDRIRGLQHESETSG